MKLKAYTRENYRHHLWRRKLQHCWKFMQVFVAAIAGGLSLLFVIFDGQSFLGQSDEVPIVNNSFDRGHDFHLIHGRLYGSRYKPISRVETDLPLTYETQGFDIDLEWVGKDQNILTATDRNGRYLGTRLVELNPRADMDNDYDVDENDRLQFLRHPFDIDLNGEVNEADHQQFDSWMGWERKK